MILDSRHPGEICNHITAWIDTLAPAGICGVRMDGATTRDLIALLVACRASLEAAPTIIDLTAADYTIGGAP
ncbi:hypothetical protein KL86PLE_20074 [uncultured Pleomorphomonas sp.]|uniref:Uncharacterized protein n=1 Tax=uncultured Pleomorphomonas sp. TaxID=442121 RepID=A0A212LD44_9HYPH|nr:hypothetical protein [Pleomorphomonas carboxyditropha]SCM75407.1 hypothetical protein KL86PLE_20074 [uncultured Pleomorphomonas sp.]